MKSELAKALHTSFLDKNIHSEQLYQTKLILNDEHSKVLDTILNQLYQCDEFKFSIAFITESGLASIIGPLQELLEKGIKGKIITTNYLNFSDPKSLERLNNLPNVELRVYDGDFHTKGYIFKKDNIYDVIIGSSNLTQSALSTNKEWNLKVTSNENGLIVQNMLEEFDSLWNKSQIIDDEWIHSYRKIHNNIKKQRFIIQEENESYIIKKEELKPNKMQQEALASLNDLRKQNKDKALLISATGTGKTYLSAFDVRQFQPKKMLFLVHREQILKQAKNSFKKVIGDGVTYGILSGNQKDYEADYLFSTIQMMSREEVYNHFSPEYFDYIIIDESHRVGSKTYRKVIDYFRPKFLLGMTATPERTDGFNIYELFDYNVAYEIRLNQALEMDLLCPFHYYGISDVEFSNGEMLSEDETLSSKYFISEQRIDYIIDKLEFYSYSGNRVKGLVFCANVEEANTLSKGFNVKGYRTTVLTANDSAQDRERSIQRLAQEEYENGLDYIFTVDIFNEGIDIPEVNQVVMLRETESVIIFVQQLGRGLRKNSEKEFVNIIDFIGNYRNNYLIPVALSGGETQNKDKLRSNIYNETHLPGCSTIYFDEIAKEKIYKSINEAKFNRVFFKEKFVELKNKIGRVPLLMDFYKDKQLDPMLLLQYKNYYSFLVNIKENQTTLDENQELYLEFIYSNLANGQRPHELFILKYLYQHRSLSILELKAKLAEEFSLISEDESIESAINVLEGNFLVGNSKLVNVSYIQKNGEIITLNPLVEEMLENDYFVSLYLDAISLGIIRYKEIYSQTYKNTNFALYEKYSRKDVCRLLNWEKNEEATINGYPAKIKKASIPLFVTYHKDDDITETTKYEEHFINPGVFSWMSRTKRNLNSKEIRNILDSKETGTDVHLFMKKDDSEGKEFYYMGLVYPILEEVKETTMPSKDQFVSVVNIPLELATQVDRGIYEYICN